MDAWDIGLLKTCFLTFGLLLGVAMPKEYKKKAIVATGITYVATTIAVSAPFIKFLLNEDDNV